MSWGDVLGRIGRPDIGVGVSQPPVKAPEIKKIVYEGWTKGIIAKGSLEANDNSAGIIDGSGVFQCQHIQIANDNALQQTPGVSDVALTFTGAATSFLFQQVSLDNTAELVYISPPYIGRRTSSTVSPTFTNVGLAATPTNGYWNAANVAGELIFSNGADHTYVKQPGVTTTADITAQIKAANTFATVFGRVFAGAYVDAVTGLQALGIRWNAANGLLADWTSTGADAELLISNTQHADKIVAIRALGFDILAVLCRNGVWFGYQTGDPNRPADFKERFSGLGCIYEATAVSTPYGVVYLSDSGVLLLTPNDVTNLSVHINSVLLPLTIAAGNLTNGVFDITQQRYTLTIGTTGEQWIYEFALGGEQGSRPARWFHRPATGLGIRVVNFSPAASGGTELLWYVFNNAGTYTEGTEAAGTGWGPFGATGRWTTGEAEKDNITEEFTIVGYEIEYSLSSAGAGVIAVNLYHLVEAQTFTSSPVQVVLAATNSTRKRFRVDLGRKSVTARGTIMMIAIIESPSDDFKLYRITTLAMDSGPGFMSIPFASVTP